MFLFDKVTYTVVVEVLNLKNVFINEYCFNIYV